MEKFISYEGLPINSGGAHSISKKLPKENYNKIIDFLNTYADRTSPKSIEVSLYESKKGEYSALKILPKLIRKFGIPKTHHDGFIRSWNWKLSIKNIEKGFKALELNKDLPDNIAGPIVLSFCWNFYFKDPKTNVVLENQEKIPQIDFRIENSRIYLRLSKKSSVSVWFAFPFERINDYEKKYFNNLKKKLPFKPSEKHWRIWKKSKNGNWIPRKIQI